MCFGFLDISRHVCQVLLCGLKYCIYPRVWSSVQLLCIYSPSVYCANAIRSTCLSTLQPLEFRAMFRRAKGGCRLRNPFHQFKTCWWWWCSTMGMYLWVCVLWGRPLGWVFLLSILRGGVFRPRSFRGVVVCLCGAVFTWLCHLLRRGKIAFGCKCEPVCVSIFPLFLWGLRKWRIISRNPLFQSALPRRWPTLLLVSICSTQNVPSHSVLFRPLLVLRIPVDSCDWIMSRKMRQISE